MALKFEPTKPFANILVQPRFHPTPLAESAVGVFCIGGGRSSILFFFLSRSLPALFLALSLAHSLSLSLSLAGRALKVIRVGRGSGRQEARQRPRGTHSPYPAYP